MTEEPRRVEGEMPDDEGWLDRPGRVDLLVKLLVGLAILTVLADLFYHKHGEYGFQEWIGFDAVYGFLSCVVLVLGARGLQWLLLRREDYYE
jgi:hypothetical protein